MAFDGITTQGIVTELNQVLIDGRIDKIFQPNKNEILLKIYSKGINFSLNLCIEANNCRFHLTTHIKENPYQALNFCMVLRKHILGFRIQSITTLGLDRLIRINLEGREENEVIKKSLILELMGKHANILLLNDKEVILDSMRHFTSSSGSEREIIPNHAYHVHLSNKEDFLTITNFEEFYNKLSPSLSMGIAKAMNHNFIGISQVFVEYLISKLQIKEITKQSLERLYFTICDIISGIPTSQSSCLSYTTSKGKQDYVIDKQEKKQPLGINFYLDDFYYEKENKEMFSQLKDTLKRKISEQEKKYKTRKKHILEKIEECNSKDIYQLYGELITNNLYRIKNTNYHQIQLENYYDENKLITIPLDCSISISNNAKKYFKKYRKLKNAYDIVMNQKLETEKELAYIDSLFYELENATSLLELQEIKKELEETYPFFSTKKTSNRTKKMAPSTPLRLEIQGYSVLVGKNNKQNDYLTTKLANPFDTWFHTKDNHGSHVILRADWKQVPTNVLNQCAGLAAFYSKAKLSSHVPVDFCYVKYVKKPSGSKAGMVIYSNQQTLYVAPNSMS